MGMKYDVFVSYSRKDYVDEHGNPREESAVSKLMDFLDKHKISYWFDKNGIYSGSEFVEVITDAITESKMMIFVSSEHSNASPWTTGEIFEALEQEKLIVPFKIDNSQYNKKFRMMVRPLDFIEYYANPEIAFDSLLKTINICKKEYDERIAEEARRKAEEDARQRRAEIMEEIKVESVDYQHHVSALAADARRLIEKQKQVGNAEKKCPVCSTMQPIENVFCKKCGWTFNPVFDANPQGDKDHIFVMRSIWNAVRDSGVVRKELENKIHEHESLIEEKDVEIELLRNELSQRDKLKDELSKAIRERGDLQQQLTSLKNKQKSLIDSLEVRKTETQRLTEERTRLSKNFSALQSELNGKNKEICILQAKLTASENNCGKLSSELKDYKDKELREQRARAEAGRKEAERKAEEEKKHKIFKVGNVEFEMVAVKGGTFWMGAQSNNPNGRNYDEEAYDVESPVHQVTLSDYYIGKFEVTQELWEAVMGSNPSYFKGSKLPVEQVSWDDCQDFITELNRLTGANFRLPTEAEWEYAARGGSESEGYKYSGSNSIGDVAWYTDNSGSKTHPVGTKSPNELGIYDMSGNVYEWCQDWKGSYGSGSRTNPRGPSSGSNRVFRGGSWYDYAQLCRVSNRNNCTPGYRNYRLGFRLAVSQ